ncbi:DNA polymerase III subunit gamma/tau [Candidatus Daviesbacteria bacterium]|nr:DNA polymerase III subunit gamma/tau [Candidatus Daviesbacteria bacterium]
MADHSAYYLKYRPQTLSELIGQESVKKTLLSSFQDNRLSHAYLFVGPRGTGKTSTARILAKMVNCEKQDGVILGTTLSERSESKGRTPESTKADSGLATLARMTMDLPCNKCPTCISITDGSNLDLIEIDAASNRGIEDIRSLRDKIKLSPSSARKKVYIIDEVHMLTTEAFNALLKTLEEPPKHALFILATTEGNKVPQTILSRVQKLDFKLAAPEELLEALMKIVKEEKIDIDEGALKTLTKKSDGSFRDAVKLLDQVSTGEKITAEFIDKSLKSSDFENVLDLIQSIKDKNASAGLLNISKQVESGTDIKDLMLSLLDIFRSLVFIKNGLGEQLVKGNFTEDKYQALVAVSENFSTIELVENLDILQKSFEKMKFTSIPSLPLELAVVEICEENSKFPGLAPRSGAGKMQNSKLEDIQKDSKVGVSEGQIEGGSENSNILTIRSADIPSHSEFSENEKPPVTIDSSSSDILKLKEKWTFVLETIRPYNFSLEALLRSIKIAECTESSVIMEVPYAFHQRILEAPKNRDLLEGILSDILGRSIRVSTVLGNRPQRREDVANIEVAQDDEIIRAAAEIFSSDTVN